MCSWIHIRCSYALIYIYMTELEDFTTDHQTTGEGTSRSSNFVKEKGKVLRWHVRPKSQILCVAIKTSQVPLIHLSQDLNAQTAEKKSSWVSHEASLWFDGMKHDHSLKYLNKITE